MCDSDSQLPLPLNHPGPAANGIAEWEVWAMSWRGTYVCGVLKCGNVSERYMCGVLKCGFFAIQTFR